MSSAITTSSSEALPARSPMPLMRALHLPRAARDRRQRVGDRHAQIVVAVDRDHRLVGVRARVSQIAVISSPNSSGMA